jgi:DNA replication protein DnaC
MTDELKRTIVTTYLKQLRLTRMATDCQAMAREAEERGLGYLGYLQALLEGELAHRHEQQLRQRLKAAAFPYQKRLEDFDFSLVPCVSKVRLLELAQGTFLANHDNVLFIGPSGIGKTHLLMGLGRALCLAGYRVLFRPAVTLATELEVAHKELRLPRLLVSYRRFDLILVDELGYLPFAKPTAELLFQFFSDRYERASVALTSNLAFAQWTQVFGNEQMTAALLDRLVHRSHILTMEGESFRFRQSLQKKDLVS